MNLGYRSYLFEAGGKLRLLPLSLVGDLKRGRVALFEYAGETVRVAQVGIETRAGRPIAIREIACEIWRFDDAGSIADWHGEWLRLIARRAPSGGASDAAGGMINVLDISDRLDARRKAQHSWRPSAGDVDRISRAIWPHGVPLDWFGPAPDPPAAKASGSAAKPPAESATILVFERFRRDGKDRTG